jgi:IS30 family transposase
MPEGYSAEAMVAGLVNGLDRIPGPLLRSITFDQGSEWANWETVASLAIDWFDDPSHSSRPHRTIGSSPGPGSSRC